MKEEPQNQTEETTGKTKFVPEPSQNANHRAKYMNMFTEFYANNGSNQNSFSTSDKRKNFNTCDSQNGPVQIVQVENDNSLSSNSSSSSKK